MCVKIQDSIISCPNSSEIPLPSLQRYFVSGRFTFTVGDESVSLRQWAFCELTHLNAPLSLLLFVLKGRNNADKETIRNHFNAFTSLDIVEQKLKLIALSILLQEVSDWEVNLGAFSLKFVENGGGLQFVKILECFEISFHRLIDLVILSLKKKQETDQIWIERGEVVKAFASQFHALALFSKRYEEEKIRLNQKLYRNSPILLCRDLTQTAAKMALNCCIVKNSLAHCDLALQENDQAFSALAIKEEKQQRVICEGYFARVELKLKKQLEKSKQIPENEKHELLISFKTAIKLIKENFFNFKFHTYHGAKELVEIFCNFMEFFKEKTDPDESLNHFFVRTIPGTLHSMAQYRLKDKQALATKNCACCNLFSMNHQYALDRECKAFLLDSLNLCEAFMIEAQKDLELIQKLSTNVLLNPLPTDWDLMEECEYFPQAEEVSDLDLSPPFEEEVDEPSPNIVAEPCKFHSPIELFMDSVVKGIDEKAQIFPAAMRLFLSGLQVGSRSNIYYQESLSHLYLANFGLEIWTRAIFQNDLKGAAAIIPTLVMDLHVMAEQLANCKIHLAGGALQKTHSLEILYKEAKAWDSASPDVQHFLKNFDQALLWSRYPHSSLYRCKKERPPESLRMIELAMELMDPTKPLPKESVQAKLWELVKFVNISQRQALKLFLEMSPFGHKKDLHLLIDLFAPRNWMESFWMEGVAKLIEGYQPAPSPQPYPELLTPLSEIAALHHPHETEGVIFKAAIQDVHHHFLRLAANLDLNKYADLPAWHARNLMNLQWIIEQLYMTRYLLKSHKSLYLHDFKMFQILLGDHLTKNESHLKKILEFNWGTGIHHPWQKSRNESRFLKFIKAIEADLEHFGLEQGFQKVGRGLPSDRAYFTELRSNFDEGLHQINLLILNLKEEAQKELGARVKS